MPIDDKKQEYTYDNGMRPKDWDYPENFVFYPNKPFWRFRRTLFYLTVSPLAYLYGKLKFHMKHVGKENKKAAKKLMKQEGAVLISNHVMPLDAVEISRTLQPIKMFIPTIKTNMGFGIGSHMMRLGGIVPIPTKLNKLKEFDKATYEILDNGGSILFMAEASLMLYHGHIRPFQRGAFKYAQHSDKKIIPLCYTFHKHSKNKKGKYPYTKLNFLPIYTMPKTDNSRQDLIDTANELHKIVSEYFVLHSDPEWLDEEGLALRNSLLENK